MKKLNINQLVSISISITEYVLLFAIALAVSKICWWMVNPSGYNSVNNVVSITTKSEVIAQDIVNRAPFGVIKVAVKEEEKKASITDQVKVVGVYAAGPNNSIAFLEVGGKNVIAKIGESVLTSTINAINPDGIVVIDSGRNVVLQLSNANVTSSSSHENNANVPYLPQGHPRNSQPSHPIYNSNITQTTQPTPAVTNVPQSNMETPQNPSENEQEVDKRRKMIDDFRRSNANPEDNI